MTTFTKSDDIYNELVESSEESWLYGLVSFAVIEEQRIEWAKHFETNTGSPPNAEETSSWYQQQPNNVLLRAKGTAENALQVFSEEVVDSYLEDRGKEVEEGLIITEIKTLGRFWPQFGVNLAGGLVSAIVFSAILVILAFIILNDTSPIEIGSQITDKLELIDDGKE